MPLKCIIKDSRKIFTPIYCALRKNMMPFKSKIKESRNSAVAQVYLTLRHIKRGEFWFITINEAVAMTGDWVKSMANDFDLVIAIPRSGLLFGEVVAQKLGKPITTPSSFSQNQYWWTNQLGSEKKAPFRRVLLFDDSVTRVHGTMEKVYSKLKADHPELEIIKSALFCTEKTKSFLDRYYTVLPPTPHRFEWNLMHAFTGPTASDMDGVLCEECPDGADGNEAQYLDWIRKAIPKYIPAFELEAVITSRLEKYRPQTEEWLKHNNVKYKRLYMWELPSKSLRTRMGHVQTKVDALLQIKPVWYWESSLYEAREIHGKTKIPTLCISSLQIFP